MGRAVMIEKRSFELRERRAGHRRLFRCVGVQPILGRTLAPGDDVTGAENVW